VLGLGSVSIGTLAVSWTQFIPPYDGVILVDKASGRGEDRLFPLEIDCDLDELT
jgi:hypothetical protein